MKTKIENKKSLCKYTTNSKNSEENKSYDKLNDKLKENSNIIKNVTIEYGKPFEEYKDFFNIWSELTKNDKKII